jgi:hypothetical protein
MLVVNRATSLVQSGCHHRHFCTLACTLLASRSGTVASIDPASVIEDCNGRIENTVHFD